MMRTLLEDRLLFITCAGVKEQVIVIEYSIGRKKQSS